MISPPLEDPQKVWRHFGVCIANIFSILPAALIPDMTQTHLKTNSLQVYSPPYFPSIYGFASLGNSLSVKETQWGHKRSLAVWKEHSALARGMAAAAPFQGTSTWCVIWIWCSVNTIFKYTCKNCSTIWKKRNFGGRRWQSRGYEVGLVWGKAVHLAELVSESPCPFFSFSSSQILCIPQLYQELLMN